MAVNEVEYLTINKKESKEIDPYKEMSVKVESDIGEQIKTEEDEYPF